MPLPKRWFTVAITLFLMDDTETGNWIVQGMLENGQFKPLDFVLSVRRRINTK